jgi:hypothetical protein
MNRFQAFRFGTSDLELSDGLARATGGTKPARTKPSADWTPDRSPII